MFRIRITLLFVFFVCLFQTDVQARTLHALLVYDTLSKDIQSTTLIDQNKINRHLALIQKYTGLHMKTQQLAAQAYTLENVLSSLERIEVESDDVIFFYYAGHGYHPVNLQSPWPAMVSPKSVAHLPLDTVIALIESKKPAFAIVLADCCNDYLPETDLLMALTQDFSIFSKNHVQRNYRRLFLEEKGLLVAVGAELGDTSKCNDHLGGFFTHSFFSTLSYAVRNYREIDWESILSMTALSIDQYQTPYYEIQR